MSICEPASGLFDTSVDLSVVERGLRRGLGTTKRCKGEKKVVRIGENQGFFSRVGLLHCNWPDENADLPKNVVIKITTLLTTIAMNNRAGSKKTVEAAKREKVTWSAKSTKLKKWHNNEILFYEAVQKVTPPSFVPKMYFGRRFDEENEDVGFILMEYAENTSLRHIYDNLTVEQTEKTLLALASLQAEMHKAPEDLKRQFTVSPYEELYADILNPGVLSFRLDELRELDPSISTLVGQVEDLAKLANPKLSKREHIDMGMDPIFVQGDMYSPNLLWRENDNGEWELEKMIDFQLCHFGSAAEDITRLFISSMRVEDRRTNWERLLTLYYEKLNEQLDEPLFSFAQLRTSYCHLFCLVAFAFLGTVPEIYRAAVQSCTEEEKTARQTGMAEKVKGILEDILIFANRKQG